MITQLHGWDATEHPPWRWCVACGVGRSHAPWRWGGAFMRDGYRLQGGSEGKDFLRFLLKVGRIRADLQSMGKNTISAGFIVLACVDVIALSQFPLSLWEAVAFGVLCAVSYGMGIFAGLAE